MTEPAAATPPRPRALNVALLCFLGTVLLGYALQVNRLLTGDQTIMDLVFLETKARHRDERNIPGMEDWMRSRPGPGDAEIRERLEARRPAILESVRAELKDKALKACGILLVPAALLGMLYARVRVAWILSVIGSLLGSIAFGLQIAPSVKLVDRLPHPDARLQLFNAVALTALMVVALGALLARSTREHFKKRR